MLSSGLLSVLLVLSVLELSWCLSDEEKKIILDEHNKYRSQVSPPAKAMMKMTWDKELEALAQSYAEKCIWDHNKERGRRGENLFAMAPTLELEFAVEDWNGEEKFYNLTTSTCVPGQMCGHYTQVVWSNTHQIGCGAHFCEKIDGIETENMHLLVCNYYPPGNVKGKKPYMEGPSCEMCPKDTVCVNNLCAGALDTEEQETNSDQTNVDPPKGGAPSTCLGFSLFLLPSAILLGLLLCQLIGGINTGMEGEEKQSASANSAMSKEGLVLNSWDCPNLSTLAPMLRLLGDSGHNFLEKGGNSSKSFNLCAETSAESGKKSSSPHSRPQGLRLEAELGQRLPEVKLFQRHFGTELVKNGEKLV